MLFTTITLPILSALLPLTLSAPHSPRFVLLGSCPGTNYPLESEFTLAYQNFCTVYIPKPTVLEQSSSITATYSLRCADASTASWVFKVSASGTSPVIESLAVDQQLCKDQFYKFLDTDDAGGLGRSYCVVDGTGGDKFGTGGMSGEGMVSMLDAQVKVGGLGNSKYGELWFQSYRRSGT